MGSIGDFWNNLIAKHCPSISNFGEIFIVFQIIEMFQLKSKLLPDNGIGFQTHVKCLIVELGLHQNGGQKTNRKTNFYCFENGEKTIHSGGYWVFKILNSVLRLAILPFSVLLSAMGWLLPYPLATNLEAFIPVATR